MPPATYPDQLALLAVSFLTVAAEAEGTAAHAIEPTTASDEMRCAFFKFRDPLTCVSLAARRGWHPDHDAKYGQ